jgi:hypothetical protein
MIEYGTSGVDFISIFSRRRRYLRSENATLWHYLYMRRDNLEMIILIYTSSMCSGVKIKMFENLLVTQVEEDITTEIFTILSNYRILWTNFEIGPDLKLWDWSMSVGGREQVWKIHKIPCIGWLKSRDSQENIEEIGGSLLTLVFKQHFYRGRSTGGV